MIRAHGCTWAPSFFELIGQRLGASAAGVHHDQHACPSGRSAAAAAMSATASLPASAADSSTTTRSSANSDGLSSSASSLVLTSPARMPVHGHIDGARLLARGPQHAGDRALDQ